MRERGFVAQPAGVVAGGDEQAAGGVGAHAVTLDHLRCGRRDQRPQLLVQHGDLRAQVLRATRSTRIASTGPVLVLACVDASPDDAARAAATASTGSLLPRRRRFCRLGRSTSTTTTSAACR